MLVADDMCYAQTQAMPQLFNRIAKFGVTFSRAFVATPQCQPARATYFTGQYPHRHGVVDNSTASYAVLNPTNMLAKRLQLAGYYTAHAGKYMNGYVAADAVPDGWTNWRALQPQNYYSYNVNINGVVTSRGATADDYAVNVTTNEAITAINAASQPFFLHVGYNAPHAPATPHPNYSGVIPASRTFPRNPDFNPASMAGKPADIAAYPVLDASAINASDAFWRAQTEVLFSVDRSIAAILDALVAAGKNTNTYVIFVADNGLFHGEWRQSGSKVIAYEAAVHIPLIVSGPSASVAQDVVCTRLISQIDLAPTIYALSGATSSLTMHGVSFASLLSNPNGAAIRDQLLIEWAGTESSPVRPKYNCLRSERFKYIETIITGEKELYDLVTDPYETANLVNLSAYASLKTSMAAAMAAALS